MLTDSWTASKLSLLTVRQYVGFLHHAMHAMHDESRRGTWGLGPRTTESAPCAHLFDAMGLLVCPRMATLLPG